MQRESSRNVEWERAYSLCNRWALCFALSATTSSYVAARRWRLLRRPKGPLVRQWMLDRCWRSAGDPMPLLLPPSRRPFVGIRLESIYSAILGASGVRRSPKTPALNLPSSKVGIRSCVHWLPWHLKIVYSVPCLPASPGLCDRRAEDRARGDELNCLLLRSFSRFRQFDADHSTCGDIRGSNRGRIRTTITSGG